MKNLLFLLILMLCLIGCNTTSKTITKDKDETSVKSNDTVRIANEDVEYEIIIIEPGFNFWLESRAKQRGFYSQSYLETRNQIYVTEWNNRVNQPLRFDPNLYELRIDYDTRINYGYEVNYKLYYYFIYFQLHYKQQLSSFVPRI